MKNREENNIAKLESGLSSFLQAKLSRLKDEGNLRSLKHSNGLVDFCSNDYLGLARSKELHLENWKSVSDLKNAFNGSTGSRLLSGNSEAAEKLEAFLATVFQSEATLVFNSGYAANLAVLSSLPQKGDTIIYDELSHACIKDGARLSLAEHFNFRHNDLEDLEKKITNAKGRKWIVVESIYSMDGDFCLLHDLIKLADRHEALIILDEAHSTGNLGRHGGGYAVSQNLHKKIAVRIHTFGKAVGAHGACVAGSKLLTEYLINFARPFIYTTAPSPHEITSIHNAFLHIQKHPALQTQLKETVKAFKSLISEDVSSESPIHSIVIGGNDETKAAASHLQQKGYDVRAILSPTVRAGSERLRICLHTYNTPEELKGLADELYTFRA